MNDKDFYDFSNKRIRINQNRIKNLESIEHKNAAAIIILEESYKELDFYKGIQKIKQALEIIKKKCLYNDNLNYVAVCINYDRYKEKMSEKHDTVVVKIDWNDRELLDYLKLLTEEEFYLLKEVLM